MNDLERRLERLEATAHARSSAASPARERMREHLGRVAALRRGELGPEEAAEVEATDDSIRRRMAEIREDRGEGGR
ncbi:MAG: hypothetical protein H0U04_19875 [Rubrobacter sp.]|nr:hypothetical protein [Rubrobacter sp.]